MSLPHPGGQDFYVNSWGGPIQPIKLLWEIAWQVLKKLNIYLSYHLLVLLLSIYPKRNENICLHKDLHMNVKAVLFTVALNWKPMSTNGWIDILHGLGINGSELKRRKGLEISSSDMGEPPEGLTCFLYMSRHLQNVLGGKIRERLNSVCYLFLSDLPVLNFRMAFVFKMKTSSVKNIKQDGEDVCSPWSLVLWV